MKNEELSKEVKEEEVKKEEIKEKQREKEREIAIALRGLTGMNFDHFQEVDETSHTQSQSQSQPQPLTLEVPKIKNSKAKK